MYPDFVYEDFEKYKKYGLMGLKPENQEKEKLTFDDITPLRDLYSIGDWVHDDGYLDVSDSFGLSRLKILWDVHRGFLYLDRPFGKERIDLAWQKETIRKDPDGYVWSALRRNWYDYDFVIDWVKNNLKEL